MVQGYFWNFILKGYNNTIVTSAPYGEHWRNLRRLSALEIFSPNRLNMFIGTRRDEIKILLHRLSQNSRDNFARVELRLMFTELTCNIIMRMVAGKRYYGEDVDFEEAKHFHEEKKLVKIKTKKELISEVLLKSIEVLTVAL
ncbi:Cytochrome P450 81E8 [Vitis vinifera]|uniref:Cytochrome P450 81E8 n=1 Tax=Vitis vinifera TaxID=29760 RepID=A0A438KRN6_VITVI|nr:Cytochrome P450 81E8 [Vitis vinifera]